MLEPYNDNDYVVIRVSKPLEFWTGTTWTSKLDEALCSTYAAAARIIWNDIPAEDLWISTAESAGRFYPCRLTTIPRSYLVDRLEYYLADQVKE